MRQTCEIFISPQEVALMLENKVSLITPKAGLLNVAEERGNAARACKTRGLSRCLVSL
ncbi:hypothetical protein METHB2_110088 [Candidatus Methylobacter favarea]|uniref:Uncharacterized protein n=1 Tax=Candidatus Methylobacter favarea TaxID=2707345 RepID=A0A8S0WH76_9GAMM|nr:hypothetical protein METHB2_110088 [Candidatus Methylobacter favarea]